MLENAILETTPDTIVVAVADRGAQAVLAYATQEVRRRGGRVRVVHVVPALDVVGLPGPMVVDGDTLRRVGSGVVDPLAAELDHALPDAVVVPTVLHGPTVPGLVRAALGARSIVLQRRPHGWRRVVTMSTSNGVAAHAAGPVVVVPAEWRPDPHREQVVVAGVEDVLTAPHLLAVAFAEAEEREGRLRLVHAWHYEDTYDDLVFSGEAARVHGKGLRGDLERELAPTLRRHPDVPVELVVEHAPAAETLTRESASAGLVVLGRHRPLLSWGPHLGSVVRAVLRESACPVMVVESAAERVPHSEAPG